MTTRSATLLGLGAIALWSLLSWLTVATGPVPPFQLLAMTFALGSLVGVSRWVTRPDRMRALRQPPAVWANGIAGLFGYHALYFVALKIAPPAEAALLNYLWPLLVVLFASLLPGERLRPAHLVGALIGFAGVVVLLAGRAQVDIRPEYVAGYACALACAFVWAGYSILSRRFGAVPTETVTGFCLVTAALALACHLALERTVWPTRAVEWAAVAAAGLGPVGAAFYLWDIGCKRGDIKLLGIASYAIPVVSTLILVAAGYAEPSLALALSCLLIASGALVATVRWPSRASAGTR